MKSTLALAAFALLMGQSVGCAAATPPKGQKQYSVTYQINPAHGGDINFPKGFGMPLDKLWSMTFPGYQYATTLIAEGKAFVTFEGYKDSQITAFDLRTGKIRWQQLFGSQTKAAYDGGVVYVMGFSGQLQAFKAATGKPIWFEQLAATGSAAPTAVDGRLYLDLAGAIYAIDGASGAILWTEPVTYGDYSSPTIGGKGLYAAFPCQVYRFDPATGKPQWHLDEGSQGTQGRTAVYFERRLYVRDDVCGDAILDARTGVKAGTFPGGYTPAFVKDAEIGNYGASVDGDTLTAFSADTGMTLWTFEVDDFLQTVPVVVNGTVFTGSEGGSVFGVDGRTGTQVWTDYVGGEVADLAAGENTLIVTSGASENSTVTVYGPQQQGTHP